MNSTIECPLCKSKIYDQIKLIPNKWLIKEYKNLCEKDFSYLFEGKNIGLYDCSNCHLKYFHPKITGDELFYSSLQTIPWYYLEDKDEYHFASNFIQEQTTVLDVGCGMGAFSKFVDRKNALFIGLDFSSNARKMAKEQGVTIHNKSIQEYASEHPETVDLVTSFQVCEHISDIHSFIESKTRVLKKGGRMIIAVPSDDSYLSKNVNSLLNMPPHHISRWPDMTFNFIANQYNLKLEIIHHEPLQELHHKDFLKTFFEGAFLPPIIFDSSIRRKVVKFIAIILSKIFRSGIKPAMGIHGNTVIAVFKKL